ncbi:MAG TPA: phosphomannomutase/phosphoglucomutase, partial [Paracoccaceae bacterium]|nr:phosphomannomutase/phosphoglucomutase [Paracoccaceae bacterium]
MQKPLTQVEVNTRDAFDIPMIRPTGFREYDARWRYPEDINLAGIQAVGLGFATQLHRAGLPPTVVTGNDYRSYAPAVKQALILGLMQGGAEVQDIGTCTTPMAYFAQFDLSTQAVAMVTASHNPNGWTGVKIGMDRPLTHGPEEMAALRDIVLQGEGKPRPG